MNENNIIYLVYADDTTRFIDNSEFKNCNVFKRLVHVEFRRDQPIDRSSLLKRYFPDFKGTTDPWTLKTYSFIQDFVDRSFELHEAERLIERLSKSNIWVNIHLEKYDIDEFYRINSKSLEGIDKMKERLNTDLKIYGFLRTNFIYVWAALIFDMKTGDYSSEYMILDNGLEVQLTLMLKSYPYPKRENVDDREPYKTPLKMRIDKCITGSITDLN